MVLAATALAPRVQSNIGIIRGGVERGLSSTAINALIRSTGQTGLRRTDLLAGIRHAKGITESASRIRSTPLDRFPNPANIQVAKGQLISNFSYEVRIRGIERRTGDFKERFITIRSNTNLTPRQIQDAANEALEQAIEDRYALGGLSDVRIVVVGAVRKG